MKPEYMSTVRAQLLGGALLAREHLGRQTLDGFQQVQLGLVFRAGGQLLGEALADDGARIGKRVHRVPHAVDEPRAVIGLLVHDLRQVGGHFVVVFPVLHVFLDLRLHGAHLVVRAAVAMALQRAEGRRIGGIGVGIRRGEHMGS